MLEYWASDTAGFHTVLPVTSSISYRATRFLPRKPSSTPSGTTFFRNRLATNRAVPTLYPELKRKYGNAVTCPDNPVAYIRTEFGFGVLNVATEPCAPDRYRSFIDAEVSRGLLERAFLERAA